MGIAMEGKWKGRSGQIGVSVRSRELTERWDQSILGDFGIKKKRPLERLK